MEGLLGRVCHESVLGFGVISMTLLRQRCIVTVFFYGFNIEQDRRYSDPKARNG